jgi:hypothetical protein
LERRSRRSGARETSEARGVASPQPFHAPKRHRWSKGAADDLAATKAEDVTSNPLRILEVLDRHLSVPVALHVYGRSALALGFPSAPEEFHATMDVDAILPANEVQAFEQNEAFWRAQELTNEELGDSGLYFTHLFEDRQVILTPDWLENRVRIQRLEFQRLELWRPSTADLILTKMMRVDTQDRADIEFLLRQVDVSSDAMRTALKRAVVPDVEELREAFASNRSWLESRMV